MNGARRSALLQRGRFGKFVSVGAVGAVVDLTVSSTIVLTTPWPPELAKFIGAECAIVLMFVLNDRWTFTGQRSSGLGHVFRRLVKSNIVRSGGLLVQVVVVFVLVRQPIVVTVGGTDVWPILTMPVAIGCGFLFNYVGETLVTWRVHRDS